MATATSTRWRARLRGCAAAAAQLRDVCSRGRDAARLACRGAARRCVTLRNCARLTLLPRAALQVDIIAGFVPGFGALDGAEQESRVVALLSDALALKDETAAADAAAAAAAARPPAAAGSCARSSSDAQRVRARRRRAPRTPQATSPPPR
jgi:hypothetical protein